MSGRRLMRALLALGALGLLVAAAAALLLRLEGPPAGPQPVAWDRVSCARCRMLVGDPAFAAQLHTRRGDVEFFDDPGCALLQQHDHAADVHAIYFQHLERDRWLRGDEVAFARVEHTPMGYGLGAVERGTPGALAPDAALRTLQASGAE